MYVVRNNIMIIAFENNIRGNKFKLFINTLLSYKEDIEEKKVIGIYIDISKFRFDVNLQKDLVEIVTELCKVSKKLSLRIGIGDYSLSLYKQLRKITQHTPILLLKNFNVAKLFFAPKTFKKEIKILIFDNDEENLDSLSKQLARLGYCATGTRSAEDFQRRVEKRESDIIITHTSLNESFEIKKVKKLSISKKVVENLPVFMDTAVETLMMLTGLEATKNSHSIKTLDVKLPKDIVISMMSFKGEIQGNFILIFPKKLAMIAIEAMLGEMVSDDDIGDMLDGVSEFCNIITGGAKTVLTKKGMKVLFDLPKTYTSIQSVVGIIGQSNGLWVEMQLEKRPFYMFITS